MPASSLQVSSDTEVALLLCVRFGDEKETGFRPLTHGEYSRLAGWLRRQDLGPADLLGSSSHLADYRELNQDRVEALLDRGDRLACELERWTTRGLWLFGRGDPGYPTRWRARLGAGAPAFAFGIGNRELLEPGGLGIVGSREADDEAASFSARWKLTGEIVCCDRLWSMRRRPDGTGVMWACASRR